MAMQIYCFPWVHMFNNNNNDRLVEFILYKQCNISPHKGEKNCMIDMMEAGLNKLIERLLTEISRESKAFQGVVVNRPVAFIRHEKS